MHEDEYLAMALSLVSSLSCTAASADAAVTADAFEEGGLGERGVWERLEPPEVGILKVVVIVKLF